MKEHCVNWETCPLPQCPTVDRHHLYFPASEYTKPIERMFRNLGSNIVTMCRNEHVELHRTTEPPEKPSEAHMAKAIVETHYPDYKSVRKKKIVQSMLRSMGNA